VRKPYKNSERVQVSGDR